MNVLFLGARRSRIIDFMDTIGDNVDFVSENISIDSEVLNNIDFIVSYGYRYIIKEEILRKFAGRVINLHISYLPWNRGADPNLWSFLEDTPKGITIHVIDAGIDTGPIIAQQEISYEPNDTLRSTYERLTNAIEEMFVKLWPSIRMGSFNTKEQELGGTFHRLKDRLAYEYLLIKGWDTPVMDLLGKAKKEVVEVVGDGYE